jgi:hypothetical protein
MDRARRELTDEDTWAMESRTEFYLLGKNH